MNKYIIKNALELLAKVMRKLKIFPKWGLVINDYCHHLVNKQLEKYFVRALSGVKNIYSDEHNNIIWILWWQGPKNMPLIIKRCIQSIIKNSGDHKVIFIDKYNIKHYARLPKYIYNKVKRKYITLTELSDIIRVNLLNNYGGLWVDSTMYCTSTLNNTYFTNIYTSGGYSNEYHQFVSAKWTSFLIGGYRHEKIFQFMDNFFQLYWKTNNRLIDYFMLDFALNFAYKRNISNFKFYVDNIAWKNNPHLHYLVNMLNNKFNYCAFRHITSDTNLFKLTYKHKFNNKKGTFYNKLINGKL